MTWPRRVALGVVAATLVQLVVLVVADLPQVADKGFGARLVVYPVLMAAVPLGWLLPRRRRARDGSAPWGTFGLLWTPFLLDVTSNTADLYDRVAWWDDALHLGSWFLLCLALGRLLVPVVGGPRWVLVLLVAGTGALLAVVWEVGEWFAFVRDGTERSTAYEDTLGDQVLGSTGAALAGLVASRTSRRVAP